MPRSISIPPSPPSPTDDESRAETFETLTTAGFRTALNLRDEHGVQRSPSDFAVADLLLDSDLALIVGTEKQTFKTFLAVSLAVARLVGGSWFGKAVTAHPGFIVIASETRSEELMRRISSMCIALSLNEQQTHDVLSRTLITDRPLRLAPTDVRDGLRAREAASYGRVAARAASEDELKRAHETFSGVADMAETTRFGDLSLQDALQQINPGEVGAVVIDSLRYSMVGNEDSSSDAGCFVRAARDLGKHLKCPVVILHHARKGGDRTTARGSGEITAGVDVIIRCDTRRDMCAASFELRNLPEIERCGYELKSELEGVRMAWHKISDGGNAAATLEQVHKILANAHPVALTESGIRTLLADANGNKGKASLDAVRAALDELRSTRQIATADVRGRNGQTSRGWRLSDDGSARDSK